MPLSTTASTTALLQEALALQRRGSVAEAAARYSEVLRADPDNTGAYYYLGMMACQAGHFDEGAELARKALARDPRHANAHPVAYLTAGLFEHRAWHSASPKERGEIIRRPGTPLETGICPLTSTTRSERGPTAYYHFESQTRLRTLNRDPVQAR
jgi:tetratricopeptide (TPR) repeat protein